MTTSRRVALLLAAAVLLSLLLACGAAAPTEAPEPVAEEPPAPEFTAQPSQVAEAPAEEAEPGEMVQPSPTVMLALPTATLAAESLAPLATLPPPAITEQRRLTLEFPAVMRLGDTTRIFLKLEVDDQGGITPTAVVEGNVVTGEIVQIPDLYETHHVTAEARLDLAGMVVEPSQTISEPLSPGKPVNFYWSVRPNEAGRYQGSVWLHLRFIPKSGGVESRIPVSVQLIDIQVNSFLGILSGSSARGFGAAGSVVGTILGIPFLGDASKWLLKWLWGKRKPKASGA